METYYVIEGLKNGKWQSDGCPKFNSLENAANYHVFAGRAINTETRIIKITREVIEPEKTKVYY